MIAAALRQLVIVTAPWWGLTVAHYAARYRVAVAEADVCAQIGDHSTARCALHDAGIAAAGLARVIGGRVGAAWMAEATALHGRAYALRRCA